MSEEIRSILGNLDLREEAEAEVKALVAEGQFDKAAHIANEYAFADEWLQGLFDEAAKVRAKRIREQELERRRKVEAKAQPSSDWTEERKRRAAAFAETQRREAEEEARADS